MNRLLCLALLVAAPSTLASPPPLDFDTARGAREVGMGGTFREVGIGANAADGNPAQLAMVQAYQLEFGSGWDARNQGWYLAGWARDSTNPELSGAYSLHYLNNDIGGGARLGQWEHSLSLATRLGDIISVGIGGRWLIQSAPRSINAATMNAGIALRAGKMLTLGFAGYNLIDTHHPELSRAFEVGFSLLLGPVRLASEVRSDLGHGPVKPIVNAGGELFLGRMFVLRAGWEWQDPTATNYISGGFGVVVDTLGLDIGYRHGLSGASDLVVGTFRLQLQ